MTENYQKSGLVVLFSTIFILSFSFYLEYMQGWKPCPLCLMQRACVGFIGIYSVILVVNKPAFMIRFSIFASMFFAVAGTFFALRQLWLQSVVQDDTGMCMPGLDVLMHYFSWNVVLKALFWGTSRCSEATFSWLGVSMPLWSAVYFLIIFSFMIYCFCARQSKL